MFRFFCLLIIPLLLHLQLSVMLSLGVVLGQRIEGLSSSHINMYKS